MKNTNNLFGTDWMEQFQLWDKPINSFCQKIQNLTAKLKEELKETFPKVFSGGLGRCKMSAKNIGWLESGLTYKQPKIHIAFTGWIYGCIVITHANVILAPQIQPTCCIRCSPIKWGNFSRLAFTMKIQEGSHVRRQVIWLLQSWNQISNQFLKIKEMYNSHC